MRVLARFARDPRTIFSLSLNGPNYIKRPTQIQIFTTFDVNKVSRKDVSAGFTKKSNILVVARWLDNGSRQRLPCSFVVKEKRTATVVEWNVPLPSRPTLLQGIVL